MTSVNNSRKYIPAILIAAFLLAAAAALGMRLLGLDEDQAAPEAYGLEAMTSLERLPYLNTSTFAGMASSYDRSEGNSDGFGYSNFLYEDEHGDKVMLDLEGPGTIYRMWFTGYDPIEANVKVYFDGEETPRVHMLLSELFGGSKQPFAEPFVVDDTKSSGGFVSYLPLPFAKSVKITTNGRGASFFYNLGYHTYSSDTRVSSWQGAEDAAEAIKLWSNPGRTPVVGEDTLATADSIRLEAGASQTLLQVDGPRSIFSIKLKIPGVEPGADAGQILNKTRLRIYWDGDSKPAVDAPVGSFFAMGQFGAYATQSLPVGMEPDNTMYAYFPMPFEREARVELVNDGEETIDDIAYEIRHEKFRGSFRNVGYFKTRFSELQADALDGNDLLVLDESGSGKFVGVVQSLHAKLNQGQVDRWHLEGDEKVFVDGSQSPVIHGTGTEDFYNGGWYFNQGLFTQPLAGYTAFHIENECDSTSMYRFFTHDAIPFRNHIRFSIEHGALNDVTEQVWLLAYYYHHPRERAVLSDTLDVGNAKSESEHDYAIRNQTWNDSSNYQYEGKLLGEFIQDDGRAHTGSSEFTMALESDNEGALLRRKFDQSVENQAADIYVDEMLVWTWHKAGSNGSHSWRDEDFFIPAVYTEGKTSIRIRVVYTGNSSGWNEYRYNLFSLVP
ncbi:glycoside hydrolase family 172 protein [Paenibacillus harenae]|uniref:glycoside hydrolase family 172 protein n=1 Tax=Paenibacillus harenae TaxID=306543 RepID=UPI0027924B32|nr:glycoside hydrolase family 172 protein [Paenibacillus harenae]MDQ0058757.1 hypothetical protein [Paenibacillus harenae]